MATSQGISLQDFLPNVPTVPQNRARTDQTEPRTRRRNSTKPVATQPVVTATVTPVRKRRAKSPPIAPVQPEEGKREKFLRIGGSRMVNVLRSIRLLGNLANGAIYEWKPEDVELMRKTIDAQLDASFGKFEKSRVTRLEETFAFEH
jgi:hypothetical protein